MEKILTIETKAHGESLMVEYTEALNGEKRTHLFFSAIEIIQTAGRIIMVKENIGGCSPSEAFFSTDKVDDEALDQAINVRIPISEEKKRYQIKSVVTMIWITMSVMMKAVMTD